MEHIQAAAAAESKFTSFTSSRSRRIVDVAHF